MESVKDLIVDVQQTEVSIALMENHRLIELNKESSQGHNFSVGDVHLGRVKKILPALNAAFVDIGDEKEAFIHYLDLGLHCGISIVAVHIFYFSDKSVTHDHTCCTEFPL